MLNKIYKFLLNYSYFLQVFFIILIIIFIYHPTLYYLPASDHWCYLIQIFEKYKLTDILKESYSFTRTRLIAPGDASLFRPILFVLMGLENYFFRNNFSVQQFIGIVLHILNSLLLFNFLLFIKKHLLNNHTTNKNYIISCLPLLITLFFSLNPYIIYAVIWTHLHGYLLAYFLIISAVFMFTKYLVLHNHLYLWSTWLLTFFSAFTYELGWIFAVIIAILLLFTISNKKMRLVYSLTFLSILFIYFRLNILDKNTHKGKYIEENTYKQIIKSSFHKNTIINTGRFINYSLVQPFFPSLINIEIPKNISGRIKIAEEYPLTTIKHRIKINFFYPFSLLLLIMWLFLVFFKKKNINKKLFFLLILLFCTFITFCYLQILGRMNLRNYPGILTDNCYYSYFPLIIFLIFSFIFINLPANTKNKLFNKIQIFFSYYLILIVLINSYYTFKNNILIKNIFLKYSLVIKKINKIVMKNTKQNILFSPNISLFFEGTNIDNTQFFSSTHGIPITTILYRKCENNKNPELLISLIKDNITISKINNPRINLPTLVKIVPPYNIYFYNNLYYGILFWDGFFSKNTNNYSYKIYGKNISSVINSISTPIPFIYSLSGDTNLFRKTIFWETYGKYPHEIIFDFYKNKSITKYLIKTGGHGKDSTQRMPTSWIVYGSNDKQHWDILDKQNEQINWEENEIKIYKINNPINYQFYRIKFLTGLNPNILRIYCVELF